MPNHFKKGVGHDPTGEMFDSLLSAFEMALKRTSPPTYPQALWVTCITPNDKRTASDELVDKQKNEAPKATI